MNINKTTAVLISIWIVFIVSSWYLCSSRFGAWYWVLSIYIPGWFVCRCGVSWGHLTSDTPPHTWPASACMDGWMWLLSGLLRCPVGVTKINKMLPWYVIPGTYYSKIPGTWLYQYQDAGTLECTIKIRKKYVQNTLTCWYIPGIQHHRCRYDVLSLCP